MGIVGFRPIRRVELPFTVSSWGTLKISHCALFGKKENKSSLECLKLDKEFNKIFSRHSLKAGEHKEKL